MTLFKNNWEALFFLTAVFWYIAIPLGIALIYFWIRWIKHTSLSEVKLGIFLFLLLLPVFGLALVWSGAAGVNEAINSTIRNHHIDKLYKAYTWVLQDSATVAGIHLAPETKIHFNYDVDMNYKNTAQLSDITSFELSAPTKIWGITVYKRFSIINRGWETYLPFDQKISGWSVGKGKIQLTEKGQLKEGYSAKPFTISHQKIPAGSLISLWSYGKDSYYIGTEDSSFIVNKEAGTIENPFK